MRAGKWKGFWVALFSGVTEVVGAGLGYGFLKATGAALGDGAYGALFGLVAGMMVAISIKELLPTARRYDKEDKHVPSAIHCRTPTSVKQ